MRANDLQLIQNIFKVSDFKMNVFESISDFKRWIRSPKSSKRGIPRRFGDQYENLIHYYNITESSPVQKNVQLARQTSNKFKSLDQREHVEIKVGSKIALLSLSLIPGDDNNRIELSGFVNPKRIIKINKDFSGQIDSIDFDDGSTFPENSEFTTVGGVNITNTIFFPDSKSASYAHTKVWMLISHLEGQGWKLDNYLGEGKKKPRSKKRSRIRRALYGPGPYGMYGTDAGYGGDGGVGETIDHKKDRIKEFVKFCFKKLNLKQRPRIRLTDNVETTALGYFVPQDNTIVVVVKGRHQMDIMRTLAHELVHLKQSETRELDGSTGSSDENEANAMAGVLLRVWGKLHPEYFVESRKFTDVELAIMEGGGSVEDNHTYYLKKHLMQQYQNMLEDSYKEGGSITHDGVEYDFDKVLAMAEIKPTKQCPVSKLKWVLEYDKPDINRLKNADISVPVVITKSNNGKLTVIDGLHRLAKAVDKNVNLLPVKYITNDELQSARLKQGVAETVNPAVFRQGFEKSKSILDGKYTLIAKNGRIRLNQKLWEPSDQFRIEVKTNKGVLVGWVNFENIDDNLEALDLYVDVKHRRKGIATEIYRFARELGNTIKPSNKQTALGKTMWQGFNKKEQGMSENFADGKSPDRKGLAKRSGVNCKANVSSLRKTAKNSSGEKQRMAHWCANMKAGKNKK